MKKIIGIGRMTCNLCEEEILQDEDMVYGSDFNAHRECMLRSVTGGIGHLLNHDIWCLEKHDSDAGMSYRESALLVDKFMADRVQWVNKVNKRKLR